MERLQKVLAQAGIASRRAAEELILQGRVKVNGQTITVLGSKVDVERDKISVDGKLVGDKETKVFLLLNKPAGYVTTLQDPQGRPKVVDLLKDVKERVYPVGRLDCETEGLLILTNDGELTYTLTHPKFGVEKTYLAQVTGVPEHEKIRQLRTGVQLEDGMTAPAQVRRLTIIEGNALLEIKIHEGRNRQVRRMCDSIGHEVIKLQRAGFGNLTLAGLKLGSYRELSAQELVELRRLAGQGKSMERKFSKAQAGPKRQARNDSRID